MEGITDEKWLSEKGAVALETYAEAIPGTTALLTKANDEISQSFATLYRNLGPRADDMRSIISIIEQAITEGKAAIELLPEKLMDKASEIRAYLSDDESSKKNYNSGGNTETGHGDAFPKTGSKHEGISGHVSLRVKTAEGWRLEPDGSRVFDRPEETGKMLDSRQGRLFGFKGTCGLVSCENILLMAGFKANEKAVVQYAAENGLCDKEHDHEDHNGGTTAKQRSSILSELGIPTVNIPCNCEDIAKYVSEGRGVIVSVHAGILYYGRDDYRNNDLHAITITSVKYDADGNLLGFFVCDSNGMPARYYDRYSLEAAFSGRNANVTEVIIR